MAILVDYQKVREDENQVEYRFGAPEMNRRLVIDKGDRRGSPADGTADRKFEVVLGKILRQHRDTETWPEGGTYAA